jgi:hypothetical protein
VRLALNCRDIISIDKSAGVRVADDHAHLRAKNVAAVACHIRDIIQRARDVLSRRWPLSRKQLPVMHAMSACSHWVVRRSISWLLAMSWSDPP